MSQNVPFSQDLSAEDIEEFQPGKPTYLYYMGIGVQTNMSHGERRIYGAQLIRGLLKSLIDLGKKGIEIDSIYARSDTPDGIRLMRHMGLTEIPSTTDKRNFVLKVAESGMPEMVEYKKALQEWQEEQSRANGQNKSTSGKTKKTAASALLKSHL